MLEGSATLRMSFNWPTFVLTGLSLSLAVGQVFAQPATLTTTSTKVVYTTYIRNSGIAGGATQLPNHATVQRGQTQIIKPAQLHEIMGSGELEPLLQQLLSQTVPNWQQSQQQQQQQQQHFFVYKNSQAPPPTSQQPQILPGFNGVNVQQQQQLPQSTSMPIQLHHQHQQQQQQPQQLQYIQYLQTAPKIAVAGRPIAGGAFVAPPTTLVNAFQPNSPEANNTTMTASTTCERCCSEQQTEIGADATPCPCCVVYTPLLSASVLKSAAG